jgi:predicted GIY-YIG superfamily endonuclease
MTIGLYAVVNKQNGKAYIGSSKQIELRLIHHKSYIKTGLFLHYQGYAEDAKKHGVDSFDFRIICKTDTIKEARELETEVLQTWGDVLYNKAPNADGATGIKRDKKVYVIGAAKRLSDPKYRIKLSEACKGKRQIVTCPHCEKQGGGGNMRRYHFDNCKAKK